MSQKLRRKVSCYLPNEQAEHYQEQAARRGISLSAYLVEAVSVREQIEQLQGWMEGQFDGIRERLSSHPESDLLRLAGLDREPRDFLLAALLDFKKQLGQLTPKDRDFYTNKGREILARMNGAAK